MTKPSIASLLALQLCLAGCATTPKQTSTDTPLDAERANEAAQQETAIEGPKKPHKEIVRLKFVAVGDMMLGTDYPDNHLPDDDGISFLGEVEGVLSAADLTFGNLEGVLTDDGEPAKKCSNPAACYLFRSPTRYARLYADAGFDALSLANNHARDFGEEGRSDTMVALKKVGIAHSGRQGDFASLAAEGLTVSFVAFAVTQESNLLHDYSLAANIVAEQAGQHDLVVVSFHGGAEGQNTTRIPFAEEEYFGEPRGDVVRFARSMVDSGADFVFGHGPHVVRGMERYEDRLIAYSLGNFATYYGISVSGIKGIAPILEVTVDENGRFLEGVLHSTVQVRPGGPRPDPDRQALTLMRDLSKKDFGETGLKFHEDGRISAAPRGVVTPTVGNPVTLLGN